MNVVDSLSRLAFRYLKREQFLALRGRYLALRTRLEPLTKAIYGTFDADALRVHLEERIGTDYQILMVHSSVNYMKPMYTGNPLELVRMLMEFCGSERTLVMPAFYFGDPKIGGAAETFRRRPRFDVRRTPSQMGLATELFRRTKGVRQSRHPIFRVAALGPLAEELTRGHESAGTPTGMGTPFDFMANHDTMIIGIGKSIEVLTQVHHAEDILGSAFPVPPAGGDGSGVSMTLVDGDEEIPFSLRGREFQWPRRMLRLRSIMGPVLLQEWRFHHMPLFATRARDVTESLMAAARRGVTLYQEP